MKIGIDLDGVCFDFAGSLRHYLTTHRRIPHRQCTPPSRWEFYLDWGLSFTQFLQACHDGVNAGVVFQHGDPYPGTREGLRALKAAGHTLHVITDRSFGTFGSSEAATRTWLDRHDLPFDSLTFSPDKTIVPTDYMIEDKPENYAALDAAGCAVYLMDRPWNHHINGRRVTSLPEFAKVVTT